MKMLAALDSDLRATLHFAGPLNAETAMANRG